MEPITFKGAPGSPYTRKMLALLRYRRVPYRMLVGSRDVDFGLPKPKVHLLPTFYLQNAEGVLEAVTDSTPLIRRLDEQIEGREVIPAEPALAWLDELIEDYADEWLTKAMFHYRWFYDEDLRKAGSILPYWWNISAPQDEVERNQKEFTRRQVDRLYVVGSNPATANVIEDSYRRFVRILEDILRHRPFVLGERPSACDFAIYGQLTQLVRFDPTPSAIALENAPRVYAWIDLIDDLSGVEVPGDGWMSAAEAGRTLSALIAELGRTYCPVMLANAAAVDAGADTVKVTVQGARWDQTPFPYQRKCVRWLRASYAGLPPDDRATIDALLRGTGCEPLLAG